MSRRIAVVGAGMAAARFAQQYRAHGGDAEVVLYGAEPRGPYNRVLLADVLTGRHDPEAIALPHGAGTIVRGGCEVVGLDPVERRLRLSGGESAGYDELVLATGANPVLPPLRGLYEPDGQKGGLKEGVHAFRTLADCARLAEDAAGAERAVVIGGGVLGVSAARALAALGLPVEIVHQAPYLIERHLDERAGNALRGHLAALGVETYPGNRARALRGERASPGSSWPAATCWTRTSWCSPAASVRAPAWPPRPGSRCARASWWTTGWRPPRPGCMRSATAPNTGEPSTDWPARPGSRPICSRPGWRERAGTSATPVRAR